MDDEPMQLTIEWMEQAFVMDSTPLSRDVENLIKRLVGRYGVELSEDIGINRAVLRLMQHCDAKVD